MIKHNWVYNHNFENSIHLVSECEGKEIQMHLLTSPKNTTYFSPTYIAKYIGIMNEVVQAEWNSFIRMVVQHRKLYKLSIDFILTKENDKEKGPN